MLITFLISFLLLAISWPVYRKTMQSGNKTVLMATGTCLAISAATIISFAWIARYLGSLGLSETLALTLVSFVFLYQIAQIVPTHSNLKSPPTDF